MIFIRMFRSHWSMNVVVEAYSVICTYPCQPHLESQSSFSNVRGKVWTGIYGDSHCKFSRFIYCKFSRFIYCKFSRFIYCKFTRFIYIANFQGSYFARFIYCKLHTPSWRRTRQNFLYNAYLLARLPKLGALEPTSQLGLYLFYTAPGSNKGEGVSSAVISCMGGAAPSLPNGPGFQKNMVA